MDKEKCKTHYLHYKTVCQQAKRLGPCKIGINNNPTQVNKFRTAYFANKDCGDLRESYMQTCVPPQDRDYGHYKAVDYVRKIERECQISLQTLSNEPQPKWKTKGPSRNEILVSSHKLPQPASESESSSSQDLTRKKESSEENIADMDKHIRNHNRSIYEKNISLIFLIKVILSGYKGDYKTFMSDYQAELDELDEDAQYDAAHFELYYLLNEKSCDMLTISKLENVLMLLYVYVRQQVNDIASKENDKEKRLIDEHIDNVILYYKEMCVKNETFYFHKTTMQFSGRFANFFKYPESTSFSSFASLNHGDNCFENFLLYASSIHSIIDDFQSTPPADMVVSFLNDIHKLVGLTEINAM